VSDVPGGGPEGTDPWDAWRRWTPSSGGDGDPGPWDAWKTWQWTPRQRPPSAANVGCSGCGSNAAGIFIAIVVIFMLLSSFLGSVADSGDLSADGLIAAIDGLPVTGPRDERPPDRAAGETTTFPAPGAEPAEVADQIQAVRAPSQRDTSGASTFLLYEEATVAIQSVTDGSEVVVFEDNRDATRRFPTILLFPGWSGTLDNFDTRARSRGGIGGFRGGGGGLGK
jgi:hypothetical protein